MTTPPDLPELADLVTELAGFALAFGRVDRATYHPGPDGAAESDTDHTVMLSLLAGSLAAQYYPRLPWWRRHLTRAGRRNPGLDPGEVAIDALVHDTTEVYAGDTPTLRALGTDGQTAKEAREAAAATEIRRRFRRLPWLPRRLDAYERQDRPSARFVRGVDKLTPKPVHVLNDGRSLLEQDLTADGLRQRYDLQRAEMAAYLPEFPLILALHQILCDREVALLAERNKDVCSGRAPGVR